MIEDGGGSVIPFGDVQALADVVIQWTANEGLRKETGRIGRDIVAERYSMARYVEWLLQTGLD